MMNCNRNRQMVKRRIYSFQMDGESRAEAICRAFQQYTLVDWALYDRVSFQIVSSVKHPLLMRELSQLMSIAQSFKDSAQVEFLQESQAGAEQRLLLVILAYRDGNESPEEFVFGDEMLGNLVPICRYITFAFLMMHYGVFLYSFPCFLRL